MQPQGDSIAIEKRVTDHFIVYIDMLGSTERIKKDRGDKLSQRYL